MAAGIRTLEVVGFGVWVCTSGNWDTFKDSRNIDGYWDSGY